MKKEFSFINKEKLSVFQIAILILSIYVLAALLLQLLFKLPAQIVKILDIFDFIVCIIFLIDFFYRLFASKNKISFLKWGWIDFISSIPTIDILRWGRFVRIFRILRLLRAFKSTKTLVAYFFKNRANGSLVTAAIITFLLVLFGSIAILSLEDLPTSNIHNAIDAVWWAFSAISTSGSGDKYSVTSAGKLLSVLLAAGGIGLFGTFTAYIARYFLEPEKINEKTDILEIRKELEDIKIILRNLTNGKSFSNATDISQLRAKDGEAL